MEITDGYYIVEVDGERYVGERVDTNWYTTGAEFDVWQYGDTLEEVKIIARIDLDELKIITTNDHVG